MYKIVIYTEKKFSVIQVFLHQELSLSYLILIFQNNMILALCIEETRELNPLVFRIDAETSQSLSLFRLTELSNSIYTYCLFIKFLLPMTNC
jgi:hypothetical protein